MAPMTRGEFLKHSAGLLAFAGLPRDLVPRREARVLIVGGGPAGLTAAWELTRAGHDVRVFEARQRPGGRIHTLREPFEDGLYAEAGALFLVGSSPGVAYAREFGLPLAEVSFAAGLDAVVHIDGRSVVQREGLEWPFELKEEERGLTHNQILTRYARRPVPALVDDLDRLNGPGFPQPEYAHVDRMSFAELWEEMGASEGALRLLRMGYFGGYEQASVLQYAREVASFDSVGYQVQGGNDRICRELATRLGDRIRFGAPVRSVDQDDAGVRLTVEAGGGREVVDGDFVVLTPPPPVLRTLELGNALSPLQRRALQELGVIRATRVFTQTPSRWWEAAGLSGTGATDFGLGMLANPTARQPGTKGILESYTMEAEADAMAALDPAERMRVTRDGLRRVFGAAAEFDDVGTSVAWGEDPWSLSNLCVFGPGQFSEFLPALRAPNGRVHLAGDTIGGLPGYSHGAFRSGLEVAAAIGERA